jgi:hypothetical protein
MLVPFDRPIKGESVMMNFKLIGAVALSLMIATPAMAAHQRHHSRDGRELPVQDALHFGYDSGQCGYHSGYGGLYGDGYYPDNACSDGGSHLID